ncbi:MAG: type II toxin-antitoxin system HicB family antitoxin [Deltaproteobacteria bacterium]|nr:type II toxin-antitoxin system HicB family antitoxin [Deltaproteobacteria bacterium]
MKPMTYKGYSAAIEYSDDDGFFVGQIAGIQDLITFHGHSVEEMRAAFKEAVDDYIEACAKIGRPPNKPYSGKLVLRLPPELHAHLAIQAQTSGKSLNSLVTETLSQAAGFGG